MKTSYEQWGKNDKQIGVTQNSSSKLSTFEVFLHTCPLTPFIFLFFSTAKCFSANMKEMFQRSMKELCVLGLELKYSCSYLMVLISFIDLASCLSQPRYEAAFLDPPPPQKKIISCMSH